MKKLMLMGFERFLAFTVNPTMRIAAELDGHEIGGMTIISKVMPVNFHSSGQHLLAHNERFEPDAVISLGLAAGRYKITPERIAINFKDGEPDNEGNQPVDEPIREAGKPTYLRTLPARQMVDRLKAEGLSADISNTAGAYLCNNVMYEGRHYAETMKPSMRTGFIHIPASHELGIEHGKIPSWSGA